MDQAWPLGHLAEPAAQPPAKKPRQAWATAAGFGHGPVDSYIVLIYKFLMHLSELVYDVGRLHRLMTQFAGQDLGQSEAAALSAVAQHPRRITELSQVLNLTQPRVTIVVASLVDQGLLRRTADPGDGRAVVLELTARGVEVSR
jgi:DNA-binding MarR family transcriptional regulator